MATKKRTKRFDGLDGSMVDQDAADQEVTSMTKRAIAEGERDEKAMPAGYKAEAETSVKASAKPSVVTKEQLAKSGLSLRDYMNKQQGLTRRGGGESSSAPASTPASPSAAKSSTSSDYSNEGKGDSKYRKQTMTPESEALEAVHPEQYFMPGGGLKTVANLAKGLANRSGANALRNVSQGALPAPTRRIGFDKAGDIARQRAARAEGRDVERLSENARRSGVSSGSASEKSIFDMGMKRGGNVKKMASGGSVSSASRRGDGIATKGKTRGKMC